MDELDDLPGLMEAEDPLAWAGENLPLLGEGETARVFAVPGEPRLAVRVSDYPDGWFGYAMALHDILADSPEPEVALAVMDHAPRAHEMRYLDRDEGGFYVALCERLDPGDPDPGHVEVARALARTPFPPCLDGGTVGAYTRHGRAWVGEAVRLGHVDGADGEGFLAAQPRMAALLQALPAAFGDMRDGNWMLRGTNLVLQDPSRTMSPADEARFRDLYGARPARAPAA